MKSLNYNFEKFTFTLLAMLISFSFFAQSTISSVASGNWNNPAVWDCNCVPTSNDEVYINPYNIIEITADSYTGYLGLEPHGQLIMNQSFDLHISGDFDIMGTLLLTDGGIIFDGEGEQYIDAGGETVEFNNITIDNNSVNDVTFYEAEYILKGTLYPIKGNMVIEDNPYNHFVINADSSSTGRVDTFNSNFTLTGEVEVETYIGACSAGMRDLSSSVQNSKFSNWDSEINIFGSAMPDGCAPWGESCDYSAKKYVSDSYTDIVSLNDTIENTMGYELDLCSDSLTFDGAVLVSRGELNGADDIVVNVPSGWSIKGNPYASAIDFDNVTLSGVTNYFYVYNHNTGSYEWYDGNSQTSSISAFENGVIAMGQGFYVEGTGTMTFSQSCKTTQESTLKSDDLTDYSLYLTLSEDNTNYSCKMSLEANEYATDAFDQGLDITHLMTGNEKAPSICVNDVDKKVRKNYFEQNGENKTFDLFTRFNKAGYYTISSTNIENFNDYTYVRLIDNETGEIIELKAGGDYNFYSEAGDFNRFTLVLVNGEESVEGESLSVTETQNEPTIFNNGQQLVVQSDVQLENAQISIYNLSGQLVRTETISNGSSHTLELPNELNGVFIVTITSNEATYTKKILI